MVFNEKMTIYVSCGDSMEISITPLNDDETPYFLKNGEYVKFLVSILPGSEPVIEKTLAVQDESGALKVWLSPDDTRISRSSYIYEAKLLSADEDKEVTFIGGGAGKPRFIVV